MPCLSCFSCRFAMVVHSAETTNAVCDPRRHALLHVPYPRELVYGDPDKDVENLLFLLITACFVAMPYGEILSLLSQTHAPLLRVFCSPRWGSSPLRCDILGPSEPTVTNRHSLSKRPRRGVLSPYLGIHSHSEHFSCIDNPVGATCQQRHIIAWSQHSGFASS